jgi:sugar lactone lactonase YvrE
LSLEKEIPFNSAHPAGIVWNGKNIFVITWTRSLTGTKFGILKMDAEFKILKSYQIKDIQEPSQMAWDGKNIWVSSWYDGRIYKMDPDTMDILGYITSPVKKTTGIAFEGAFLWVTGTYSDLYKMELQN